MWLCMNGTFPYKIKVLIIMSLHVQLQSNSVDFELPICFSLFTVKTGVFGVRGEMANIWDVFTFHLMVNVFVGCFPKKVDFFKYYAIMYLAM